MNANELLHYLRGFFELVTEPTPTQIQHIRTEILQAQPLTPQIIPVEVVNPLKQVSSGRDSSSHRPCDGCKE